MPEPNKPSSTPRVSAAFPPRWGFFKGFLTGAVIEVPALAAGVWVLARLGIGDPQIGFMRILRLTTVFAGIAAVFTAGGIGRLAAHASVDKVGGRVRAIYIAARAHAAAGAGLIFIAAIPHGHFPNRSIAWLAIPLVGMVFGALCGVVIGTVCGGAAPVRIADVMALARKPSDALRQLLDPEDLLRIGAAVRDRTTHLFEGMFEPAQRPPAEAKTELEPKATEAAIVPAPKDAPREGTQ
jgi:hypothetical protein